MNPILKWLHKHDGYSFEEGVAVLLCFSANRGVNTLILSRHDRRHLASELNRLAHVPNLKPLPGMTLPETMKEEKPSEVQLEKPNTVPDTVTKDKPVDKPELPKDSDQEVGDGDVDDDDANGGGDIVTFLDLERHEKYDPDKLPPTLKDLWIKNRDEYKELQYCHAQMKLANSDAGRADWRRQVFEHRDSIEARWKLFKEEKARLETEADTNKKEETAYIPINDRSYISRALKKESWDDETKLEVQKRVDNLQRHKQKISEETLKRLRERGIIAA